MKALKLDAGNVPEVVEVAPNIIGVADALGTRAVRIERLSWRSPAGSGLLAVYPSPGQVRVDPVPLGSERPVLIVGTGRSSCVDLTQDDVFAICREVVAQEYEGATT